MSHHAAYHEPVSRPVDEYERSADYVDIMLDAPWRALGPLVAEGLTGYEPTRGPIVDVGAGTGRGVLAAAAAAPTAEIVAVEPSRAMRAVLMARVGADDDLRHRVTVVNGDHTSPQLPDRYGAVLALNVIGHLDPRARAGFWAMLAQRLAPDATALVNLQPPPEAVEVPATAFATVTLGRLTYQGSGRAEPAGTDQVMWHMTYRTVDEEGTVSEEHVSYRWWVLSEAGLQDEVTAAGLLAEAVDPEAMAMFVLRRSA